MKIKEKLKCKKQGFLDDFLPSAIFLLIAAVMFLSFMEINAAINKKAEINAIARQYTLRMETKGCLNTEDIAELTDDLNNAGFTDASGGSLSVEEFLAGCNYSGKDTNGESVGYGNEVELSFRVYTKQWIFDETSEKDLLGIIFKEQHHPISIEYHSTSKE